jgi:hypothetical protein
MFYYFDFQGFDRMSIEDMFTEISNTNSNINIGQLWLWAIQFNHFHIVKELSSKIGDCPGLIDIVAEYGYLEMLIWLFDNRKENYTGRAIHLAASKGHLLVVQFLYNNLSSSQIGLENHLYNALNDAVRNGHFEVVKWLYYNTNVILEVYTVIEIARFYSHINIINWLTNEVCGR